MCKIIKFPYSRVQPANEDQEFRIWRNSLQTHLALKDHMKEVTLYPDDPLAKVGFIDIEYGERT